MANRIQSSSGGFSEYSSERPVQDLECEIATKEVSEERLFMEYLLEAGFEWEEASRLLRLREHLYENAEMRQRMSDDYRMQFVQWLYEQGEISENSEN